MTTSLRLLYLAAFTAAVTGCTDAPSLPTPSPEPPAAPVLAEGSTPIVEDGPGAPAPGPCGEEQCVGGSAGGGGWGVDDLPEGWEEPPFIKNARTIVWLHQDRVEARGSMDWYGTHGKQDTRVYATRDGAQIAASLPASKYETYLPWPQRRTMVTVAAMGLPAPCNVNFDGHTVHEVWGQVPFLTSWSKFAEQHATSQGDARLGPCRIPGSGGGSQESSGCGECTQHVIEWDGGRLEWWQCPVNDQTSSCNEGIVA